MTKLQSKLQDPKSDDIAVVEFTYLGKKLTGTLKSNGVWECQDPQGSKMLNVLFNPKYESGPAYGPFGTYQVHQLVKRFEGKILKMRKFDHDPNAIY